MFALVAPEFLKTLQFNNKKMSFLNSFKKELNKIKRMLKVLGIIKKNLLNTIFLVIVKKKIIKRINDIYIY